MIRNLYYELTENGYHIYDENDPLYHVHQYEPYIPNRSKTYEENAQEQIHGYIVSDYVSMILAEQMSLEEVPQEYYGDVKKALGRVDPDDATEEDYLNALAELGVTDDEESNA